MAFSGDAIFHDFEMILPRNVHIDRGSRGAISIFSRRMEIFIQISFDGYSSVTPRGFSIYMKKSYFDIKTYQCEIDLSVRFSVWSLLTFAGWQYFGWIDSFIEYFDREFYFDTFIESIGWERSFTNFVNFHKKMPSMRGDAAQIRVEETTDDKRPPSPLPSVE